MNLEEFVEQNQKSCPICGIAEQEEVEAAHRRGVGPTLIMRWLVEVCGHDAVPITVRKIRNHFESRHTPA